VDAPLAGLFAAGVGGIRRKLKVLSPVPIAPIAACACQGGRRGVVDATPQVEALPRFH